MSDEAVQRDVTSSDEKSCSEACEEELFNFTNKRTPLEDLEEETIKQMQDELYQDCRNEDVSDESDRRKWKRKTEYSGWNVLDKPFNDAKRYDVYSHLRLYC